jgi:hypothetical protein
MLWQPYPVDRETAAALRQMGRDFVVPWDLLDRYVQRWAYPEFRRLEEACADVDDGGPVPDLETLRASLDTTVPLDDGGPVPDLETLLASLDTPVTPRERAVYYRDEFVEACAEALDLLREGVVVDHPGLEGSYLQLPYLPLGDNQWWWWLIPLVDGSWIDRRLVELCEVTARLGGRGFIRVPPLDPHLLAWHRFFPRHSRWQEPPDEASPHKVLKVLKAVTAQAKGLRVGRWTASGRPLIHVEDYLQWGHRQVPEAALVKEARGRGLVVTRWNAWIRDQAVDGAVPHLGLHLTRIRRPWVGGPLQNEMLVVPTLKRAAWSLARRGAAIKTTLVAARGLAGMTGEDPPLTELQKAILNELGNHGRLSIYDLAVRVNKDRRTLYKGGGLKDLKLWGFVAHPRNGDLRLTEEGRKAMTALRPEPR